MSSFKLKKSESAKSEARGAGAFALLLGIVGGIIITPYLYALALLGLIFLIASFAASE